MKKWQLQVIFSYADWKFDPHLPLKTNSWIIETYAAAMSLWWLWYKRESMSNTRCIRDKI
jgi:hypothetical protein